MAEIREELTLVDKFSETFNKFNEAVQKLTSMTDKMQKSGSDNNKQFKDMNDWFGKNNDAAQRLADRGLNALTKRLVVMAGAYVGIRKLTQAIQEAGAVSDQVGRLGNYTGNYNTTEISGIMKNIGNTYGTGMSSAVNMQNAMSRLTGNEDMQKRMLTLAARLEAINPNMNMEQILMQLSNTLQHGGLKGFADQMGLRRTEGFSAYKMQAMDFGLQLGRSGTQNQALSYLEEISQQAGATQDALERMWDNPHRKMQRLANIWNNELVSAAQSFMTAIKPALDKLEAFFQSQQFASFMGMVSQVFAMFGKLFEQLISKLVANAPMITDMLAKAFTVLYKVLGWVIDNFDEITKVVAIVIGGMLALKVATTLVNTAMQGLSMIKFVMSNPFTALIASAVMFVTILDQIFNPENSIITSFLNAISLVANAIAAPFLFAYNVIAAIVNSISELVNWVGDLMDSLKKGDFSNAGKLLKGALQGRSEEELTEMAMRRAETGKNLETDIMPYVTLGQIDFNKWLGDKFNLGDKSSFSMDEMVSISQEVAKTVADIKSDTQSLASNMDPDAWMDSFKEVSIGDMERQSNFALNNDIQVPAVNIIINEQATGKYDRNNITNVVRDALLQGLRGSSSVAMRGV